MAVELAQDCLSRGDFDKAEHICQQILEQSPADADALSTLALSRLMRGKVVEAVTIFERALIANPLHGMALEYLGLAQLMLGEFGSAQRTLGRAMNLPGAPASVRSRYGVALLKLGRFEEAVTALLRAVALAPDDIDTRLNLAAAFTGITDLDRAQEQLDLILEIAPAHVDAMFNLGTLSLMRERFGDARIWFERVIDRDSQYIDAYVNLGITWQKEGDFKRAIATFSEAVLLDSRSVDAQFNLGQALYAAGRMREATDSYKRTLDLQPAHTEARWALTVAQIPGVYSTEEEVALSRTAFEHELSVLENRTEGMADENSYKAIAAVQPFLLAYQEENNRELLRRYRALCSRAMSRWFEQQRWPARQAKQSTGKIRLGIASQYFRKHSVWDALIKGWFSQLDRRQFELYAFHLGGQEDEETQFAKRRATHFEGGPGDLRYWVDAISSHGLDALIYPEIGMEPLAVQLAGLRLAPVQIAAWGHPETTGLVTIDYYLSAEFLEPSQASDHYVEQLVRLPQLGSYYEPSTVPRTTSGLGVSFDRPVFVCPGVPFKYLPKHDHIYIDIARRLGPCRFIFFRHHLEYLTEQLQQRLKKAFDGAGLEFDAHVTFLPWLGSADFFWLLERADVYLDTIGFSGFNTAIRGTECGIPIVTREGPFMRGRLASAILRRMGLDELVVSCDEDYVELVMRLATDSEYRIDVRGRIKAARSLLFEDTAPIRAMERFLAEVTRNTLPTS